MSHHHTDLATLRGCFIDALDTHAAQAARVDGAGVSAAVRTDALRRWDRYAPRLFATLEALYAGHPDQAETLPLLVRRIADCIAHRPGALQALDAAREAAPDWFLGNAMLGYSAYVDRFGGDLRGVAARVPYLQRLGVRYLHLLPFLQARAGDNDGGFAVRDYDAVEPALGTMDDLELLTARLRAAGISLCADLVLNHTADDHRWALAARGGDARCRGYYHVFADPRGADAYAPSLREVFPQTAPGNFTDVPGLGRVWTTFYPYQWDLNWSNPAVFAEMALTLLRLANRGVEAFRLDSTAYLWKRAGTDCMNQPEAHRILQALRAVVDIAAPGVLLKAEAIVPTRELPPYFGMHDVGKPDVGEGRAGDCAGAARECHLAYHSSLMAALWAGLAEQRGDIVARVLADTPALPAHCAWLGYLRCHDDIGWGVLAHEAAGDGAQRGYDLARVAAFYAGETADSYARGQRFQSAGADHVHGSNGMSAALAGVDAALAAGDADALRRAERRLQLLQAAMLAGTGLPTLYMGDEIALGNDEGYRDDPARAAEGRWLQRPAMDWALADAVAGDDVVDGLIDEGISNDGSGDEDDSGHAGEAIAPAALRLACARRVHAALRRLLRARAALPMLRGDAPLRVLPTDDPALLCIARGMPPVPAATAHATAHHAAGHGAQGRIDDGADAIAFLGLFNFGERPVPLPALPAGAWQDALRHEARPPQARAMPSELPAHGLLWLRRVQASAAGSADGAA